MLNVTNNASNSASLVNNHEKRIEAELEQLVIDIRRLGPSGDTVSFGELFDDDDVQNYYEALVGTLKCAKKRGIIKFKGQMLLKGMHDSVTISIADGAESTTKSSAQPNTNTPIRSSTPASTIKHNSPFKRTSGGGSTNTPLPTGLNESFDTAMAIKGTPAFKSQESPGLNQSFDSGCAVKGTPAVRKTPGKQSHSFLTPPRNQTPGISSRIYKAGQPPPPPPPPPLPPSAQQSLPPQAQTPTQPEDNASDTETEISVRRLTATFSGGLTPNINTAPSINLSDSEAEVIERRTSPRAKSKQISSPPSTTKKTKKKSSRSSITDRWTQRTTEHSWKNPHRNNHVRHYSTSDIIVNSDSTDLTSSSPVKPSKLDESLTSPTTTSAANAKGKENRRLRSKNNHAKASSKSSPSPRKTKARVKITVMSGDKGPAQPDTILSATSLDTSTDADTISTLSTPQALKKTQSLQPKKSVPGSAPAKSNMHRAKSERIVASIGAGMDEEVARLLEDIRRVGSNPGEPNVTFGELFDDDIVQNTYEALIGTLRSAKRQGLIKFQGQVLFKGMHDHVVIEVVGK